jgi:uncharacterized protein YutE (UPF0331/DUF86 family)
MSEVLSQKIASLQRSVSRAREELARAGQNFARDYTAQDAAVLNAIRACETSIDLANMVIRRRRLGIPNESRESFELLVRENIVNADLGAHLQRMVGFRDLAVHRYRELDMQIVATVISKDLDDLLTFAETVRPLLE